MLRSAAVALVLALACGAASAETATSWGGTGLIETRDARFRPDGAIEVAASIRRQRRNYTINVQALAWLETTFRFTERLNATTGRGITTDRAFDLKLRLVEEDDWRPALAVGLQDLLGTGLYAGEYVVASKRWYDLDISLGLGWGRLGTGRDVRNPLCAAADGASAKCKPPAPPVGRPGRRAARARVVPRPRRRAVRRHRLADADPRPDRVGRVQR